MTTAMNMNIRVILAAKGINMRDLANLTGYSHGHIKNVCCGSQVSRKAREKINATLGVKVWNDQKIKAANEQCSQDQEGK